MDYEKKYKEALEWARKVMQGKVGFVLDEVLERFPELKESEDERIRNEIIAFVEQSIHRGGGTPIPQEQENKWIAWLEKQGEHKPANSYCQENCKVFQESGRCFIDCFITRECKAEQEYIKQSLKDSNLHLIEQKSAYNVEPKFHAYDFITDGERIFQIKETVWERNNKNDGSTYCESLIVNLEDGVTYSNKTDLKEYHLWTIQDAKDGDVLCDESIIFIFKDLLSDGSVMSYCNYDTDSGESDAFCPLSMNLMCSKITPATKEQRDTLIKAMADAGYTFDFEKKELKKIEQKQVIDYLDNLSKDNWELIHEFVEKFGRIPKDEDELNVLVEYVLKRCKPAEWSEEDNRMCKAIIDNIQAICEEGYFVGNIDKDELIDWLKSLRPQKQQKWSKQDIEMIDWLIRCCEKEHEELCNNKYGHQEIVSDLKRDCRKKWDWLESLKDKVVPQKQWKPSEGQLRELENVFSPDTDSWDEDILRELYKQLKQLC